MRGAEKGKVYLVGSGPGDPDLLTMRAVQLLQTADIVLHDDLVTEDVLQLVHRGATATSVGKRFGKPKITQAGINRLMVESAHAGQSVVRLKSGDPLVFGRAAEEIAALREAGIPFEVVPGVTAAFAAGAMLSLPLTDRQSASKLIFCTGHYSADKLECPPIWNGPPPEDATLVVYMPGRNLARIAQELKAAGVQGNTPCCAVSQVATARQSYAACRLADLAELECGPAPLLLLIGRAMESLMPDPA